MKHPIIIALLLIATTLTSSAQLRYGVRLGGLFAKPTTANTNVSATHGSGFSGGLMLEYQFEHNGFAPDIALLYTRYASHLTASPTVSPANTPASHASPAASLAEGDGNAAWSFYQSPGKNFLELPIHLKYKFWLSSTKKLVAPMLYTGPSLMFALDKALPLAVPPANDPAGANSVSGIYTPPGVKRFNAGWDVGLGIDIINFIQLQAGYRFPLTNALSTSPSSNAKLHLNAWTLSANILFDF